MNTNIDSTRGVEIYHVYLSIKVYAIREKYQNSYLFTTFLQGWPRNNTMITSLDSEEGD